MLERIAALTAEGSPQVIIEIGPGRGALTELLLHSQAHIHAIELDAAMVEQLNRRFPAHPRLTIHHTNVLDVDLSQWGPASLAGNLPYYITSPILERIFQARASIAHATLLIQKEVADRLVAKPASRDYGYLSVVTQSWSTPQFIMRVGSEAFKPPPKVDSAVVHLTLHRDAPDDVAAFLRFAGTAFRQKRKTLRNNLQHLYPNAD